MPRVVPKLEEARRSVVVDHAKRRAASIFAEAERISERSAYRADGPYSWFRDLWSVAKAQATQERALLSGDFEAEKASDSIAASAIAPDSVHGGLEEARSRLRTVEKRDVTMGDPGAASLLAPGFILDQVADAIRNRGVLRSVMNVLPMPLEGKVVKTAKMATGASADVHTEAGAVSETDFDSEDASAPKQFLAGQADMSIQAYEFPGPGFDSVLARDLGNALAERLDIQILSGSGSGANLLGFRNTTGIQTASYTDATPTQAEMWPALMSAYASFSSSATGFGFPPNVLLLHPRRLAWFSNWKDSVTGMQSAPVWPEGLRVVAVPSISTVLGAGTNEDEAYYLRIEELPLYLGDMNFRVLGEPLSGTLQVRAQLIQVAANFPSRQPRAILRLSGTGFSAPAFT